MHFKSYRLANLKIPQPRDSLQFHSKIVCDNTSETKLD